jgi:hypothetical protein
MSDKIAVPALEFAKKSGESLHQAQQLAAQVLQEETKIAAVVPGLVDRLVTGGLLEASEKSAATQKLSSPVGALEVLQNMLDIRDSETAGFNQKLAAAGAGRAVEPTPSRIASPAGRTKDASENLETGGYVGRQRGAGEFSGADFAMAAALGVAVG